MALKADTTKMARMREIRKRKMRGDTTPVPPDWVPPENTRIIPDGPNPHEHPVTLWKNTGEIEPSRYRRILSGEMLQELLVVTPKHAEAIIDRYLCNNASINASNRHEHELAVEKMERMLLADEIVQTSQGLSFSVAYWLQNGQHRTWGIYLAQKPWKMFVCFNEPKEALKVLDDIETRRKDEHMSLGYGLAWASTGHTALANGVLQMRGTMTNDMLYAFLSTHEEAVREIIKLFGRKRPFKGAAAQQVQACVFRAWIQKNADHDRLRKFVEVLFSGEQESKQDNAAIKLREYLRILSVPHEYVGQKKNRSVVDDRPATKYYMVQSALRSFLERRSIQVLRPVSDEQFPIPEDRGGGCKKNVQSVSKDITQHITEQRKKIDEKKRDNPNLW